MLKALRLVNFRKHKNLEVQFGPGLTAMKGPNESGKSTIIEGLLYVLYGAKSLREPYDKVVPWDNPTGVPAGELDIQFNGDLLTFKRSKAGAEVRSGSNILVTGQVEVTNFATTMLGADAAMASNLMMAKQNGLRGSLEQGTKATSEIIESLADFDLFDRLLEAMQHKLTLGATASFEKDLQDAVEESKQRTCPSRDLLTKLEQDVIVMAEEVVVLRAAYDDSVTPAGDAMMASLKYNEGLDKGKAALGRAREESERAESIRVEMTKVNATLRDGVREREAELNKLIDDASANDIAVAAYEMFSSTKAGLNIGEVWEGSRSSLEAELKTTREKGKVAYKKVTDTEAQIKIVGSRIVKGKSCTYCGKDLSTVERVLAENLVAMNEIEVLEKSLDGYKAEVGELSKYSDTLNDVLASGFSTDTLITRYGKYLEVDVSVYPPIVSWPGPVPVKSDPEAWKAERTRLQAEIVTFIQAEATVNALKGRLNGSLAEYELRVKEVEKFSSYTEEGAAELNTEWKRLQDISVDAKLALDKVLDPYLELKDRVVNMKRDYDASLAWYEGIKSRITKLQNLIEETRFNNTLLKKVRAARPIIADKLWNTVLAAVSTMFSRMRGEVSVVTKDKDGFKVNGNEVGGLSGSTLDILGLAIRIAMVKTFIPQCPFIVLDEPMAGCDGDRGRALLGFVAASGFDQILLVTHEEDSESVADQLFTLGE
jgi:hypothetical protein